MVIPEGFGHAFITLEPNSTCVYVCSAVYSPSHESGIRYDDTNLDITWPVEPAVISCKDQAWGLVIDRMLELDEGFLSII
jgi:dTDP-4-dehydrorhamnose 3,5-epimerase